MVSDLISRRGSFKFHIIFHLSYLNRSWLFLIAIPRNPFPVMSVAVAACVGVLKDEQISLRQKDLYTWCWSKCTNDKGFIDENLQWQGSKGKDKRRWYYQVLSLCLFILHIHYRKHFMFFHMTGLSIIGGLCIINRGTCVENWVNISMGYNFF